MSAFSEVAERFTGQPHDSLFKAVFGDVPVAWVLSEAVMHPYGFARIDEETFEQVPGSLVDPRATAEAH